MKPIDADTILTWMLYNDEYEEFYTEKMTVADYLDSYTDEGCPPTLDVVPVRKGKNLKEGWTSLFECSKCGESCSDTYVLDHNVVDFCPHCGADMRGAKYE